MLQTYYNHSKLLYPVLLVIKCLARSCKYTCTNLSVIEFMLIIHGRVSTFLHFLKSYDGTVFDVLCTVHSLLSEVVGVWLLTADVWICFQIKLALKKPATPVSFIQLYCPHKNL